MHDIVAARSLEGLVAKYGTPRPYSRDWSSAQNILSLSTISNVEVHGMSRGM